MPPSPPNDLTLVVEESAVKPSIGRRLLRGLLVLLLLALLFSGAVAGYFYHSLTAPSESLAQNFTIESGSGVRVIGAELKAAGLIRQELSFYLATLLWYDPTALKAGNYRIDAGTGVRELIEKFTAGDFVLDLVRVTHIEGERVRTLASRVVPLLENFDPGEFIALAEPHEGTIFPDTYLVPRDFTAEQLFTLMSDTFTTRTEALRPGLDDHPSLSRAEVIILASILEREANSAESKKMVSGILQNRLRIGMALQADASIEYVLDKPLSELTPKDLERDSPYNTYLYPGLPPTAIGNPGLTALEAVLNPTPSDFLFYITGNDGRFYYAKDFDQHRVNITRHLR